MDLREKLLGVVKQAQSSAGELTELTDEEIGGVPDVEQKDRARSIVSLLQGRTSSDAITPASGLSHRPARATPGSNGDTASANPALAAAAGVSASTDSSSNGSSSGSSSGPSRERRFILRLALALHAYGSSASRTEFLIERIAKRLGVDLHIAVFPSLILLSFNRVAGDDTAGQETHMVSVTQELDLDKLGRADELARMVGLQESGNPLSRKSQVMVAFWQLRSIATSVPTFGPLMQLVATGLTAGSSTALFFGGGMWDIIVSTILGLFTGLFYLFAISNSQTLTSILEFLVACFTSFIAQLLATTVLKGHLCPSATIFGTIIWTLPGVTLTLGVNELVAGTLVTGSARVGAAIFSAMEIGFGIAVGCSLCFWAAPEELKLVDCPDPNLPAWLVVIWLIGYMASSNISTNARWDQWTGMTLVALVAYFVSLHTAPFVGDDASSVVAAFAVSVSGTLYSHFSKQFPLAMKISGIQMLVPGGLGVRGVAKILEADVLSGIGFVFEMLTVALAITIGLLLAKLVLPESMFAHTGRYSVSKTSLAEDLLNDMRGLLPKQKDKKKKDEEGPGVLEEEESMAF